MASYFAGSIPAGATTGTLVEVDASADMMLIRRRSQIGEEMDKGKISLGTSV